MFVQECSDLSQGKNNMFYSMQEKKNVHVHFEIIASLGDQPERRSINYLMLGNSTFFSRYRYAANVGSIWNHLPSCGYCHSKMIS